MKAVLIFIGSMVVSFHMYAQVGIGNTSPKAMLDINASSTNSPTATDGLLIPRINAFPTTNPGEDQDGMLVFYSPENIFYFWENSAEKWLPLYGENTTVINGTGQHYVGELWGGGIVFYVYENGQHGLIASLDDLDGGSGADWGPRINILTSESWWDGDTNTSSAVAAGAATGDAVYLCENYSNEGFSDWHLPSMGELKALEEAAYVLSKVLDSDGDPNTNAPNYNGQYWSSTQVDKNNANSFKFTNTHTEEEDKDTNYFVRAVRSF